MVIIQMSGGLGNQMFQYALYLKLIAQGKEVKFDDINEYRSDKARPIMLSVFGIDYPRATWEEIIGHTDGSLKLSHRIRRKLRGRKSLEIREKDSNFDANLLEHDPAYLTGYFQTEKYFKDIEATIRKNFTFPDRVKMQLPDDLEQHIGAYQYMIENSDAISVHIRRGDYLMAYETHGGICTDDYYETAIAYMRARRPDAIFYIFSNEIKWAKGWLEKRYIKPGQTELDDKFCLIEETNEYTGFLDMMLMSKCKHHIVANSSFSWWGAYLNENPDKVIVAPDRWFNNKECHDIFTDNMIKISADGKLL
ncbi:MAG: alpha-1,2-fucosyltransferase [Lachnospiraceae bacterium]|nr:alpha-1,2-fucosyltransferase [Lachnospiraceae bacterium]